MTDHPPTIALLANRALRSGPLSPLLNLVRAIEPWLRHVLRPHILVAGGSLRALRQYGVLTATTGWRNCPPAARAGWSNSPDRWWPPPRNAPWTG